MGNWQRVEGDMLWSLKTGPSVKGRGKMEDGLRKGNVNFMGEVEIGFDEGQIDQSVKANFKSCKDDDQTRLYNLGRQIIGLPPVN